MNEQYENKLEELEKVENAEIEARSITKDAKYLCYPISEIAGRLSSLANEYGIEGIEFYLDDVSEAENKLESAFYRCEEAFADKRSALECELEEMINEENGNEH
jgi:hypothetical protein